MINILFPIFFDHLRIGGVTNFVISLISQIKNTKAIDLSYNTYEPNTFHITSKNNFSSIILRNFNFLKEMFLLDQKLKSKSIDIVHINPSLSKKSLLKNIWIVKIANINNIPIIIFIHGWDHNCERLIHNKIVLKKFLNIYGSADYIFVLANDFRNMLIDWGFDKKKIFVETTMVDDTIINDFDIESKILSIKRKLYFDILFLSRIEKQKGIYETIIAYMNIKKNYKNTRLFIAGEGKELKSIKKLVRNLGLKDVYFLGFVKETSKTEILKQSDLLLFPTFHGEGMPISILESMAFGLPIITCPVGGIKDFFEDGKMGYLIEKPNPILFAKSLETIIKQPSKHIEICRYNWNYAQKHFLASKVTSRIQKIYLKTTKKSKSSS